MKKIVPQCSRYCVLILATNPLVLILIIGTSLSPFPDPVKSQTISSPFSVSFPLNPQLEKKGMPDSRSHKSCDNVRSKVGSTLVHMIKE